MIVGRQGVGKASVFHHYEREAVGQAPILIGPTSVEAERPFVQPFRDLDDLRGRVVLQSV